MQPDALPRIVHACGFPRWKWPILGQCLDGRRVIFVKQGAPIPPEATHLLLWGMSPVPADAPAAARVLRVEDGFLRSVGLGADLVRPVSWVIDAQGIYYDATRPSELETILASSTFTAEQRQRAASLRAQIVAARLTKYNVGDRTWQRPRSASRVILVAGQVESDASLEYGAPGVRTNIGLLRAAREENPDAHLVYKPHPDVHARMRREGKGERTAATLCEEVVTDVSMAALLDVVDEVHVLTSLSGFEALLRGKPVTCHGQPFYSGWGLTRDRIPTARRHRQLRLDELVAGALIEYPLYLSRDGSSLVTPEQALEALLSWREQTQGKDPWWRGIARMFLRRVAGVR